MMEWPHAGENGLIRASRQTCVLLPVPVHRAVGLGTKGNKNMPWRCKACSFPRYSPASFSSLTLGFTSDIPDWRDRVGVVCLLVFVSPSMLPAGMKLQVKCLEMKDGRDEAKIWTRRPGAGQAKEPQFFPSPVLSKLTHPPHQSGCDVSDGSLSLLPSKSSLLCPAAGRFCSAKSDVPAFVCLSCRRRQCQDQQCRVGNASHCIYFQLKIFFFENCNRYVLALPFCAGNPDTVLRAAQGGQGSCHSLAEERWV